MVGLPVEQGLYDPRNEHDACGIGFVVNIEGEQSHDIIEKGLQILINLAHRGACGCDPETGDGAGILIQIPHKFFARECAELGFTLPPRANTAWAWCSCPWSRRTACWPRESWSGSRAKKGLAVLGWRDTPVEADAIGRIARASQPYIEQIFIGGASGHVIATNWSASCTWSANAPSRKSRRPIFRTRHFFYIPSLSSRTIIYKGLLLANQISEFYTGTERSGCDERALPGAPALLDQYVSLLAAGASLSLSVPQRRNQHRPRQHQLDERAREGAFFRVVRRGSEENFSGDRSRRQRFGFARQRRRVADAGRPQPAARDGDADPGSLGCRHHHASGEEGVLRISRFADGALGRPGGDCFHRWPVHRRHARSQRAASGALSGDPRWPGDPGFGRRACFR